MKGRLRSGAAVRVMQILGLLSIAGCGGGWGGSEREPDSESPPEAFQQISYGRLIPLTQGLSFQAGKSSGVTDTEGVFQAQILRSLERPTEYFSHAVEFSVAGIPLPPLPQGYLPISGKFVQTTAGAREEVIETTQAVTVRELSPNETVAMNVARVLMMLDHDQNPENGIMISSAIRAARWAPLNWSTSDLQTETATVRSEAAALDGSAHDLPSLEQASAFLNPRCKCAMAGLYNTIPNRIRLLEGEANDQEIPFGQVAVVAHPDGRISGELVIYESSESSQHTTVSFTGQLDNERVISVDFEPNALASAGKLHTLSSENVQLTWQDPHGRTFGLWPERVGSQFRSKYRFVSYPLTIVHPLTGPFRKAAIFEIDAALGVRGIISSLRDSSDAASWHGSINDGTITAHIGQASDPEYRLECSVDLNTLIATGALLMRNNEALAQYSTEAPLIGCRL